MLVSQRITKLLMVTAAMGLLLMLSSCGFYLVDNPSHIPPQPMQPVVSAEPTPPPAPLPGSELIVFMDSTTAQLAGCRAISNINLSHNGSYADGMTILRNTAIQINANRMVPIRLIENIENSGGPHIYQAKLLRCPDQESQET